VVTSQADEELAPAAFLQLAGHPLRWRLLGELARSDLMVHELTERVAQPQNLVSYHLAKLRDGRLVSARRSSADGRDAYYTVDIARFGDLLTATGAALHPGLRLTPPVRDASRARVPRTRVLFLCTGNSARSQMAEALIEHMSGGTVKAESAGSHPKPLHPNAVRVMRKRGIDIRGNLTKHLDEFVSQRFDGVITLCDRVREVCPEFPSHPELVHWSVPDPARAGATSRASYPAFERTAVELETRIGFLIPLLAESASAKKTRGASHAEH
jgi:ArsR family transcriptional regulator, arsenate/arsenite/antimonite-responsive transcriptional repressor / arsenate reductase (thioredoxin)